LKRKDKLGYTEVAGMERGTKEEKSLAMVRRPIIGKVGI
jgi:hypothetical protein